MVVIANKPVTQSTPTFALHHMATYRPHSLCSEEAGGGKDKAASSAIKAK
jgi:hypothetical protein